MKAAQFTWVVELIAELAQLQAENFKLQVLVQQFIKEIVGFIQSQAKSSMT